MTAGEDGGRAVVRVIDNGIGIPEEFRPYVFERFSQHSPAMTRKAGGTGLGLAITKMLVETHGGQIGFRSGHGIGTTFEISFPLARGSDVEAGADRSGSLPDA